MGISFLNRDTIAGIARQSGGLNYLTPDPLFWSGQVFVINNSTQKKYNATEYIQLYNDLGTPITSTIHKNTEDLINNLIHPDIPLFCLYGTGVKTEMQFKYSHFSNTSEVVQPYEVISNDFGDGTVPLLSLGECKKWQKELPTNPVKCKEYHLRSHSEILKDRELVDDLIDILTGKNIDVPDCSQTPEYDKLVNERLSQGLWVAPERR